MDDLLIVQSPGIGAFFPEDSLDYISIPRVQPVLNPNVPWLDLMLSIVRRSNIVASHFLLAHRIYFESLRYVSQTGFNLLNFNMNT